MRTLWRGAISFGLVSIPVRLYTATEEKSLHFNQLHEKDHGRIRYKRWCTVEDAEVPYDEIVRGYEYEKDRYVILDDEDLDAVPVESTRTIDIQQFVDLDEIDPIYFKKTYYLGPEETGVKAYRLLSEGLARGNKVGVAKVSFRDKEHLATIRLRGGVLVLETMFWPDEIREAEFPELEKETKVRDQEVQMAQSLIDNLTEDWSPDRYTDEYREALLDIVQRKVEGEEVEVVEPPEPTKVSDLMEALKRSVEETRKEAAKETGKKRKAPARKRAAS